MVASNIGLCRVSENGRRGADCQGACAPGRLAICPTGVKRGASVPRRVVVTAMNMITPLGLDLQTSWDGLVAGRSGVRRISLFDPSGHATQIAAEVPGDFDEYARRHCSRRLASQMARAVKMGYVCAKEAIAASPIDFDTFDGTRCATIFGAADTGRSSIHDTKYWIMKTMPHGVTAWISMEFGLEGPNFTISAACASSACA